VSDLFKRLLLPLAIGVLLGWGGTALFGVETWIIVITPPLLIWCAREIRWSRRMRQEILADQARLLELAARLLPPELYADIEADLRNGR
jgi:hypothetical protein